MKSHRLAFLILAILFSRLAHGASVDLAVSINAPSGSISISSNFTYQITVTNLGSVRATGVAVSNELDGNVAFVSASASQGSCSYSAGMVTCVLGSLDAGGSATISISVQPTVRGWTYISAEVSANQNDFALENNFRSAQTLIGLIDMGVHLSDLPATRIAGGTVTCVLSVTNHGPDPTPGGGAVFLSLQTAGEQNHIILATNASVGTFVHTRSDYYEWSFPVLPVGASYTLELQVWLIVGSLNLYAETLGGPTDWNAANNRVSDYVTVTPGPGLLQFTQTSQDGVESSGVVYIQIDRIGGASGPVQVEFATEDATAIAGDDYLAVNSTVLFTHGETKKIMPVIFLQNPQSECARHFKARLFNAVGGAMLAPQTNTTITLFDDDVIPRGTTECISVTHANVYQATWGFPTFFSEDGRHILFGTVAENWLPKPGSIQIFLRDTASGTTRLVTANHQRTGASEGNSDQAVLSHDGRYVAFITSNAQDLTTNVVSGVGDVFVRDLITEQTTLVSIAADGSSGGDSASSSPLISSNGNIIAFASSSTNLVPGCSCEGYQNIFARDMATGLTRLVTKGFLAAEPANELSVLTGLTQDGRFVLFWSFASNLVPGDTNDVADIFVRDLHTETTLLVSANAGGWGESPRITPDGRYVVFSSSSSDLAAGDTNESGDVFIRDLVLGTTRLVSVNHAGTGPGNSYSFDASITPDGRKVAFRSYATDLVPGFRGSPGNIFVRDLLSGTTTLVSVNCDGPASGSSGSPVISSDGRYVAFGSGARDLVPGIFPFYAGQTYNPVSQIYRYDLVSGETIMVSANYDYTGGGNNHSRDLWISADGKSILFASDASDLSLANDVPYSYPDVFLWRELPAGVNADVRVASTVNWMPSVAVITLSVTNFGPDPATTVVVEDTLSGGAAFIAAHTTLGSCALTAGKVTCTLGTLARRAGAVITLTVTSTANGLASHAATVSHGVNDPLLPNNALSGSANLTLPPSATLWVHRSRPRTFVQWLSTPSDFQLESGAFNTWSPISTGIHNNGVLKTLIVDDGPVPAQFYRLHRP